jgi:hypothetical protein
MLTSLLPAPFETEKKNTTIEQNRISAAVLASLSSPDAQERERFAFLEAQSAC